MTEVTGIKQVAYNRRAKHDYNIIDTYECGVVSVSYTHLTLPTTERV